MARRNLIKLRPPIAHLQPSGQTITINKSAFALLTQDGENAHAIIVDTDGNLSIRPMNVPDGTISVTQSIRRRPWGGAARFNIPKDAVRYPKGSKLACEWDDAHGVLRVLKIMASEE